MRLALLRAIEEAVSGSCEEVVWGIGLKITRENERQENGNG